MYINLCVLWLWGMVFIKVTVRFKIELHRDLFLIGYQKR